MKKLFYALLALFHLTASDRIDAQAGTLDVDFGVGGKVVTVLDPENAWASSVAILADEKILVTVSPTSTSTISGDFKVVRYHPNGSVDSTFGVDGIAATDFDNGADLVHHMVVQTDGKIVVAGQANVDGHYLFGLARFNPDGSIDDDFGTGGKVATSIATPGTDLGIAAAIQNDGKILLAGITYLPNGCGVFAVVRYNTDGSLDSAFDLDGKVNIQFSPINQLPKSIVIQPDGKIIVAGYAEIHSDFTYKNFALARLNPDGSLDTSFDGDGKVVTNVGSSWDYGESVVLQSDGKILLAGNTLQNGTKRVFALMRYHADGAQDSTFGVNGLVTTSFNSQHNACRTVVVQPDGKILAGGGNGDFYMNSSFLLSRYNTDGSLDPAFGGDGMVVTNFDFNFNCGINRIVLQEDGKIVAVGYSKVGSVIQPALARYHRGLSTGIDQPRQTDYAARVFPNPISPKSVLAYTLPAPETVSVRLFDQRGRLLATLLSDEKQAAGEHRLPLRRFPDMPSGNYFIGIFSTGGRAAIQVSK